MSPMMQQYHQAKEAAGDALLLFRMGDFYELFYDDAKAAGELLGITVTSRDKGDNPVAMAGFPHHQLEAYLAKIIRAGRRAAVCDQVEEASQAKGLVRREVTRIVTPGTVTDDALLDPVASNFLAAVAFDAKGTDRVGIAWVDASTGRFWAAAIDERRLGDELTRVEASECLVAQGSQGRLPRELGDSFALTQRPAWAFGADAAVKSLCDHFGAKTLEGFGFDTESPEDRAALSAAGAVLDYLVETQRASLAHVERLQPYRLGSSLAIDAATWRSLEVTQTMRDGGRRGSLLGVIDRTVTSMGARQLAEWLRRPLTAVDAIRSRHEAVAELVGDAPLATAVREALGGVYDVERLVARITTGRASPRDLSQVARTLGALPKLKAKLAGRVSERLGRIEGRLDLCAEVRERLEAALEDDCPLSSREGGFIRTGYSPELDECRTLMAGGKQWMAQYQADEVERSGIPSMKIGFNKVFGYYLEITHAHRDKVPQHYIRKQTLKNAERYITPELKEHEEKVLSAEDRVRDLEIGHFIELRELAASVSRRLLATADALAELDVLAGLAELARARNYCRPEVVDDPVLDIVEGRHPVLDLTEPDGTFVPNSTSCAATAGSEPAGDQAKSDEHFGPAILLITGPNMAGKSTYIRQTALLTLMAQVGSFVPAKRAVIGVADRVFARVGASDELSRGQSTFMVEMTETARILNTATRRSLVILDEIGRGTSTYDGLSLAWAIVEHLHNSIGCRTLFATHYHELTELADRLGGVANRNVAVREHDGRVVFLHQIVDGSADKSYGIHVAELAGVPRSVNRRATEILATLETSDSGRAAPVAKPSKKPSGLQMTLFEPVEHPMLDEIRRADLENLTPMEALRLVAEWRERLRDE
ncbi:DNA mismatch repair protein MutS [Pseudobythopirellula maris]|uniref:DNA mismatch repair protein MutS n=1 Tax=Pseudobythopirellula maris TaxID=2527991 RepID=UPI0018D33347|nr:DNA mismatch repair protein MutS [Pseudobythopirellula maris]